MFGIGISITVSLAVIELGSCSLQCGISPRIVTLYSVPVEMGSNLYVSKGPSRIRDHSKQRFSRLELEGNVVGGCSEGEGGGEAVEVGGKITSRGSVAEGAKL
ncbi:hypothetical protein V1477_017677 [Vespula maculifrons]|uniref:Uncharacterized protein n=1 Tax=Vespula maculifrons TaxID=7453 RepID=A0ABD2B6Q5_VESMC